MEVLEIEAPQEEQLSVILAEGGLELTEAEQIKQSYLPFFEQMSVIKAESTKINFETPSEIDEKIARELRLRMVKIRTGSEELKKNRKKIHQLKADLEQAAWNLIKSTCELDEERFAQVERHREIKAAAERAERKAIRTEELKPLAEFVPFGIDLGSMADEDYQKLLAGAKAQQKFKAEESARLEAERIAAEKAKAEENARIKAENERLQAEKAKAEAQAKKEREALEKKLAAEKAKAEKERQDAEAKLKAEREARERLEREAKEKAEAEAKAMREAREKAAAEEKARIAAEKKAAKAPDKDKLMAWVESMDVPASARLKISDPDAIRLASEIYNKFHAFKKWAESQISEL